MLDDTIHALATAPGRSERAALRISGEQALSVCSSICREPLPRQRGLHRIELAVLGRPVPAEALIFPGPGSYTGEDVVELQLPGAPLLIERVGEALDRAGARRALPGEFTRRAVEHGRLGLEAATAVHALITAGDERERRIALEALRGGLSDALDQVRKGLLDARALCEAGLDFDEGDTGAVDREAFSAPLQAARRQLARLVAERPRAASGGGILLLGEANAGKSTLCNALWRHHHPERTDLPVLATDVPGTTRDVVAVHWAPDAPGLLDTPGDLGGRLEDADREALERRRRAEARATAALWVLRPGGVGEPLPPETSLPLAAVVVTHADAGLEVPRLPAGLPLLRLGADGRGLEELVAFLRARFAGGGGSAWPGLDGVLERVLERIGSACERCAAGEEPELVAEEIAWAIEALDEAHGESSPEDLLDRVFGAFCLGK